MRASLANFANLASSRSEPRLIRANSFEIARDVQINRHNSVSTGQDSRANQSGGICATIARHSPASSVVTSAGGSGRSPGSVATDDTTVSEAADLRPRWRMKCVLSH